MGQTSRVAAAAQPSVTRGLPVAQTFPLSAFGMLFRLFACAMRGGRTDAPRDPGFLADLPAQTPSAASTGPADSRLVRAAMRSRRQARHCYRRPGVCAGDLLLELHLYYVTAPHLVHGSGPDVIRHATSSTSPRGLSTMHPHSGRTDTQRELHARGDSICRVQPDAPPDRRYW